MNGKKIILECLVREFCIQNLRIHNRFHYINYQNRKVHAKEDSLTYF